MSPFDGHELRCVLCGSVLNEMGPLMADREEVAVPNAESRSAIRGAMFASVALRLEAKVSG